MGEQLLLIHLNERNYINLYHKDGFFKSDDLTQVEDQGKSDLYQRIKAPTVPFLDCRVDVSTQPDAIVELSKHVKLKPYLDLSIRYVKIIYMMVDMVVNARSYNVRYDDIVEVVANGRILPPSQQSFVRFYGEGKSSLKSELIVVSGGLKKWRELTVGNNLDSFISSFNDPDLVPLTLIATDWASYVKHVLGGGLLHNYEEKYATTTTSYKVVPINVEGRKNGEYWIRTLAQYREENPVEPNSTSMLGDRPHDFELLLPDVISFAALDTKNNNKMVGYVKCSLKDVHKPLTLDDNILTPEIKQFNTLLKNRGQGGQGCGYDVFCIDGLHVHRDYRGKGSISKELVAHSLEFIRGCHKTLGVTLLSSGSYASATKAILTGFGFTHFNIENDVIWILEQFVDYFNQRANTTRPKSQTPLHLLTLPRLIQSLTSFMVKYPLEMSRNSGPHRHMLEGMAHTVDWLKNSLSDEPSIDRRDGLEAWPLSLSQATFLNVIKVMEAWKEGVDKIAGMSDVYQKYVGTLFDTTNSIDTFLFLGPDGRGDALLKTRLSAFFDNYYGGGDGGIIDGSTNIIVIDDSEEDEVVVMEIEVDDEEPTERDMILYDLWTKELEKEVVYVEIEDSVSDTTQSGDDDSDDDLVKKGFNEHDRQIVTIKGQITLLEEQEWEKVRELEEIRVRLSALREELDEKIASQVMTIGPRRDPVSLVRTERTIRRAKQEYAKAKSQFIKQMDGLITERALRIGGDGARARIIARSQLLEEGVVMEFTNEKEWIRKNYPEYVM
jgi:hypothetical protein